jgi:hypothetical protein
MGFDAVWLTEIHFQKDAPCSPSPLVYRDGHRRQDDA